MGLGSAQPLVLRILIDSPAHQGYLYHHLYLFLFTQIFTHLPGTNLGSVPPTPFINVWEFSSSLGFMMYLIADVGETRLEEMVPVAQRDYASTLESRGLLDGLPNLT